MFSNWFLRWISRAMVTPSLVTTGEPVIFSRMTLRPLGPSVDFTASASWSTPASSSARASAPKRSSLAIRPPLREKRSRDEDRSTANPAAAEGGERGRERVCARVQGDLPGLGEDHQLGHVVVGADDVADDVALGGDNVQRRDVQLAAVADDEVRAAPAGHIPAVHLRPLLGDEVEDDVGAAAAGQVG